MKHWKRFLIVFIILSILAGLSIATYDPVEQVKKEQDERLQSNAAEFIQASVLYYSVTTALPWFAPEDKGANCFSGSTTIPTVPMKALEECVNLLISEHHLRRDYPTSTNLTSLIVTNPNPQTGAKLDTVVCFQPQSIAWQKDFNTRYNQDGTHAPPNRCNSQGGKEFCYWCTQ